MAAFDLKSDRPTDLTHRELLRDRIKQYVQTHLRDPDLSIHRIALALNCSKRSITDIALSWGYNSPAHFSRVFRKQFGATPSEWRARALPAAD